MLRASSLFLLAGIVAAQDRQLPQPRVVNPGPPPSDAVVLFDGKDLSHFVRRDGQPARCTVAEGAIVCRTGDGDLYSTEKFRSAQIHLEFAPPYMPDQKDQARGNSGVYLHGRYEIQILDSYQNPTYADGSLGALYGQSAPLVNAARPPNEWQSYDIIFHAPRCNPDGTPAERATLTVLLNGVMVQDHVTIQRSGRACTEGSGSEPGPLMLQDHDYKGAPLTVMRFRNIWFRRLD
jgi:hypothetical protein